MKLTLNRQQLKTIAIVSMVIDHTAWGFVDFYSPLGQFLHVLGRFTIPIMCFFIAEGYRKTSNLKLYIYRMTSFAIIAILPFYFFFHEEYGYRQNIIFDLLIGLLVLTTLESKIRKWQKVLWVILLLLVSAAIGGWPLTPICFILSFYYGRTFKEKMKWFIFSDIVTVLVLMGLIVLNGRYHFMPYEWVWWDKTYLLGFMLALYPLSLYDGTKGKEYGGRYFFYLFYPAHFMVLTGIKLFLNGQITPYGVYVGIHVTALSLVMLFLLRTLVSRPSRGQGAVITMLLAAMIYVFGFILEIMSDTVPEYHMAIVVEYFGEMILMVGLSLFVKLLCHVYMPSFVYAFETVVGLWVMYGVITTEQNHFFYRQITADNSGPISMLRLSYGPGFYFTIAYIGTLCSLVIASCIYLIRTGNKVERRRGVYTIFGMFLIWMPYFLKLLGLTGGYEIPGVGIALAAVVFYMILVRYGFLDSVTLASENALDHGKEGIIVYTPDYRVEYFNKKMENIFGKIPSRIDIKERGILSDIVAGRLEHYKIKGRIYDFEREELWDKGVLQGYMLWVLDSTEHFETLEKIREIAIKDPLTKLYNRVFFQSLVEEQLEAGGKGTFCMFDMDNFKQVNDNYGHQAGDAVLNAFAELLKEYGKEKLIGCRIGGDEFAAFLPEEIHKKQVENLLKHIMEQFQEKLSDLKLEGLCSISAGAVLCEQTSDREVQFKNLYSKADSTLYEAKNSGKNCYIIQKF